MSAEFPLPMLSSMPCVQAYEILCDACRSPEFCCNHITIEDGNITTESVQFCVDEAMKEKHTDCEALARFMLDRTVEERISLLGLDAESYDAEGNYLCEPIPLKELESMPPPPRVTLDEILANVQRYGHDTSAWTDDFKAWLLKLCNDRFNVPMPPPHYTQDQIRAHLEDWAQR